MTRCKGLRLGTALLVGVSCAFGQTAPPAPDAHPHGRRRTSATSKDHTSQARPLAPPPLPIDELPAPRTPKGVPAHRRRHVRDFSWIFVDAPEPREIKVHDIVAIIVDEKSEVTLNSRFNRRRNTTLKAELNEFMRLNDAGNLTNAAENSPTIDSNVRSRLNSTGQLTDQEGIRYRIAATVVDIRPNGNLVLEARKAIRTNWDVWEYSLTGEIRSTDINRDNTALSENIANLKIEKHQRGKVYDSTKRPWGVILYDFLSPF